jgi:hypothetical protein
LYCPACGSTFSRELKLISGPSIDAYDRTARFIVSAILSHVEGYRDRLEKLLGNLGMEAGAPVERWLLAAHHIRSLYRHYRSITERPSSEFRYASNPLTVSPPSKRSFPGAFSDYDFDYWRLDDSPFTHLSDDGFQVITSLEVRPHLQQTRLAKGSGRVTCGGPHTESTHCRQFGTGITHTNPPNAKGT